MPLRHDDAHQWSFSLFFSIIISAPCTTRVPPKKRFLDQLAEWERRKQEYEGESLETFSDGMKIAVLASHAPEGIWNVVRLAADPNEREVPGGASEHIGVSSVRPDLRQRWARS